jgi:hypothetical protein
MHFGTRHLQEGDYYISLFSRGRAIFGAGAGISAVNRIGASLFFA